MLRVALTGGIASGKSAAARIFAELGAPVSSSDEIARAMMQPGQPLYTAILAHFGPTILAPGTDANRPLDRAALARLAFTENRLAELEAIIHPPVIAAQTAWLHQIEQQHPHAVAIIESALVLETKHTNETTHTNETKHPNQQPWRNHFDRIVLLTAPESIREERYIARNPNLTPTAARADFHARLAAQTPDATKRLLADHILENNATLQNLRTQITILYAQLRAESQTM